MADHVRRVPERTEPIVLVSSLVDESEAVRVDAATA